MKRLLLAVAALSVATGTAALAQPGDHDRREERQDRREVHRDVERALPNRPYGDRDHDGIPNRFDSQPNRFNYHGSYYDRFRGPQFFYPQGFGYRSWGIGQFLPRAFFAPPYFINNWSYYRLGPPPRGLRYVRNGPDVLLVNIRTGRIVEVIPGVFY